MELMRLIEIPTGIEIVAFLWSIFSPVLIIISCYMCIERYLYCIFHLEQLEKDYSKDEDVARNLKRK